MAGCAVLVALASVAIMTALIANGNPSVLVVSALQAVGGITFWGLTAGLSLALLAGRNWARWVAVDLSVLIAAACIVFAIFLVLSLLAAWATT
jgi:hypothetical protein